MRQYDWMTDSLGVPEPLKTTLFFRLGFLKALLQEPSWPGVPSLRVLALLCNTCVGEGETPARSHCCHDCPSFGFPGNRPKVPVPKEAVGVGQADTLCCRGDGVCTEPGVGCEPLGSGRGLGFPAPAGREQRNLGSPYQSAREAWGSGWVAVTAHHPSLPPPPQTVGSQP